MTIKQRQTLMEKLLRQIDTRYSTERAKLKKCWIEENNGKQMQVFCNGYFIIMLNEDSMVDVPMGENLGFAKKFFFDMKDDYTFNKMDFSLKEIKAAYKGDKQFDYGNSRYTTQYFIDCAGIVGKSAVFYQNENPIKPSYFEGCDGIAVLLPCKKY